jgi:hypothetical protein
MFYVSNNKLVTTCLSGFVYQSEGDTNPLTSYYCGFPLPGAAFTPGSLYRTLPANAAGEVEMNAPSCFDVLTCVILSLRYNTNGQCKSRPGVNRFPEQCYKYPSIDFV